jgi:tRNA U34 5-methylaminomethyl-2-thiouridine-forming methyltransferase MnmC
MMDEIKIIDTSDGSHSLLHSGLNETYHSIHGAIQESQYVYIEQGLNHWLSQNNQEDIRILEIGFGTGLNVLLTIIWNKQAAKRIYLQTWELFPLDSAITQQLNYGEKLNDQKSFSVLHTAPWENDFELNSTLIFHKHQGDVLHESFGDNFDLIYFDAFAPSRQGEMWTLDVLRKVTGVLKPGGVWVTYCARGQVKRDLISLGLKVETLPGPPGKKEMIRATKISQ